MRVFLINPPTDETVRTPLLSFLYLAAALRRAGHAALTELMFDTDHAFSDHREALARSTVEWLNGLLKATEG